MESLHFIYHELRPDPSRYAYIVPLPEFREQCRLFQMLQQAPAAETLRPEITFDDGHGSGCSLALPALQEHGLRARFFITAGWTGQRSGYMTAGDLRELAAAGMPIGAHGWSHTLLTACSKGELDRELRGTRQFLEDLLGQAVTTMSLPGGRADGAVLRACSAAGYEQVFSSAPQPAHMDRVPSLVGRLNIRGGTTTATLRELLTPGSGVLSRLQRVDRAKATAKALLGDRLYAAVWGVVNRQEPDAAEAGAPAA